MKFNSLCRKELLAGISLTVGRTPLGVYEDTAPSISAHLLFNDDTRTAVVDCLESDIEGEIMESLFGIEDYSQYTRYTIGKESLAELKFMFNELGYNVTESDNCGEWTFYTAKCTMENALATYEVLKDSLANIKIVEG